MLVKSIICPDVDGCNFNYTCEEGSGETYATCPTDCLCGNERCDTEIGEDDDSDENYCLEDCHCGNGACDEGETCATCPADCGACYSCFLAGTLITMADGSQKPIEDIIIGDRVLSFDEDTQQLVVDAVSQTFKHTSSHFLVINNDFRLTPNHPVLSNGQWIEAGMLRVGDTLTDSANQTITVTSIEPVNEEVATYNIEVNPYHTFIANRYIVHNKDPGPGDGDGDYGASFE